MKIVLGSDHGGVDYKSQLKDFLIESGYEVIDIGTNSKDPASWSEFGLKAAMYIKNKQADAGIVFCKSGEGVCIAANKVKGVYCGIAYNDETAIKCKTHDGCNMIAFGCEYMSIEDVDLAIGDIVGGRDYNTGILVQKPVVQKILKISKGTISVDYKLKGDDQ